MLRKMEVILLQMPLRTSKCRSDAVATNAAGCGQPLVQRSKREASI